MKKELYELNYSMKKDFNKKILNIILFISCVILILNLILNFLIFPVKQTSISMEPDFSKNSCIFFSPLKKSVNRGSVVLLNQKDDEKNSFFKKSVNSVLEFLTFKQYSYIHDKNLMGKNEQIRRVIAVPGDTIYMRDYVVYIRPKNEKHFLTEFELIENPYNININAAPGSWDSSIGVYGSFDEITLSDDEYFVLGDNRNSCMDSRMWGFVSKDDFDSGAVLRFFPLNKFKFLK